MNNKHGAAPAISPHPQADPNGIPRYQPRMNTTNNNPRLDFGQFPGDGGSVAFAQGESSSPGSVAAGSGLPQSYSGDPYAQPQFTGSAAMNASAQPTQFLHAEQNISPHQFAGQFPPHQYPANVSGHEMHQQQNNHGFPANQQGQFYPEFPGSEFGVPPYYQSYQHNQPGFMANPAPPSGKRPRSSDMQLGEPDNSMDGQSDVKMPRLQDKDESPVFTELTKVPGQGQMRAGPPAVTVMPADDGGKKKGRSAYTKDQMDGLEAAFQTNQFCTGVERTKLAQQLGLAESQITNWFQNRRGKERRRQKAAAAKQQKASALPSPNSNSNHSQMSASGSLMSQQGVPTPPANESALVKMQQSGLESSNPGFYPGNVADENSYPSRPSSQISTTSEGFPHQMQQWQNENFFPYPNQHFPYQGQQQQQYQQQQQFPGQQMSGPQLPGQQLPGQQFPDQQLPGQHMFGQNPSRYEQQPFGQHVLGHQQHVPNQQTSRDQQKQRQQQKQQQKQQQQQQRMPEQQQPNSMQPSHPGHFQMSAQFSGHHPMSDQFLQGHSQGQGFNQKQLPQQNHHQQQQLPRQPINAQSSLQSFGQQSHEEQNKQFSQQQNQQHLKDLQLPGEPIQHPQADLFPGQQNLPYGQQYLGQHNHQPHSQQTLEQQQSKRQDQRFHGQQGHVHNQQLQEHQNQAQKDHKFTQQQMQQDQQGEQQLLRQQDQQHGLQFPVQQNQHGQKLPGQQNQHGQQLPGQQNQQQLLGQQIQHGQQLPGQQNQHGQQLLGQQNQPHNPQLPGQQNQHGQQMLGQKNQPHDSQLPGQQNQPGQQLLGQENQQQGNKLPGQQNQPHDQHLLVQQNQQQHLKGLLLDQNERHQGQQLTGQPSDQVGNHSLSGEQQEQSRQLVGQQDQKDEQQDKDSQFQLQHGLFPQQIPDQNFDQQSFDQRSQIDFQMMMHNQQMSRSQNILHQPHEMELGQGISNLYNPNSKEFHEGGQQNVAQAQQQQNVHNQQNHNETKPDGIPENPSQNKQEVPNQVDPGKADQPPVGNQPDNQHHSHGQHQQDHGQNMFQQFAQNPFNQHMQGPYFQGHPANIHQMHDQNKYPGFPHFASAGGPQQPELSPSHKGNPEASDSTDKPENPDQLEMLNQMNKSEKQKPVDIPHQNQTNENSLDSHKKEQQTPDGNNSAQASEDATSKDVGHDEVIDDSSKSSARDKALEQLSKENDMSSSSGLDFQTNKQEDELKMQDTKNENNEGQRTASGFPFSSQTMPQNQPFGHGNFPAQNEMYNRYLWEQAHFYNMQHSFPFQNNMLPNQSMPLPTSNAHEAVAGSQNGPFTSAPSATPYQSSTSPLFNTSNDPAQPNKKPRLAKPIPVKATAHGSGIEFFKTNSQKSHHGISGASPEPNSTSSENIEQNIGSHKNGKGSASSVEIENSSKVQDSNVTASQPCEDFANKCHEDLNIQDNTLHSTTGPVKDTETLENTNSRDQNQSQPDLSGIHLKQTAGSKDNNKAPKSGSLEGRHSEETNTNSAEKKAESFQSVGDQPRSVGMHKNIEDSESSFTKDKKDMKNEGEYANRLSDNFQAFPFPVSQSDIPPSFNRNAERPYLPRGNLYPIPPSLTASRLYQPVQMASPYPYAHTGYNIYQRPPLPQNMMDKS